MLTAGHGPGGPLLAVPQRPEPDRPGERLGQERDLHAGGRPRRRSARTEPGIGTVTFSGVGFNHDDVAVWLESLAKQKGYANPYFSTSTEALIGTRTTVNFASTVDAHRRTPCRSATPRRPEADMDKLKQWVALTVVGCLGIMAAGWFLLVSPKRTEAAEIREQAVAQESANARPAHPARGAQGPGQGPARRSRPTSPASPRRSRTTPACRP